MNHLLSNLDAVLFDLDGTLVETNIDFPLMKRKMIRLAGHYGLSPSELAGLDILAIVERMAQRAGEQQGDDAAEAARDEAFTALQQIELRHSAEAREIAPARDVVEALRSRNIKVGIVTRNCRAASQEALTRAGIAADALVCREDVSQAKPSANHLLAALKLLRARPGRSLMVGDHLMDVAAGKAAGMRTIGLLTQGRPPDYFSPVHPDAVACDLNEILSALINSHSQLEHEPAA